MADTIRFTGNIMDRRDQPYAVIESPCRLGVEIGGVCLERDDEAGTATINLGGLVITGHCLRHYEEA